MFESRLAGHWDAHLERMCDFWSTMLLGTGRFQGNPLHVHMAIPGLTAAHFDRWIDLFRDAAIDTLSPRAAAEIVERAIRMRSVLEHAID